jgi:DNA-binding MarR family transcriptional regulator
MKTMMSQTAAARPRVSLEEEVFITLQRAAEDLASTASEPLRAVDLTGAAYNVLRILRGAGERGASCNEIGERLIKRDSDITRLLDRLEKRGLIERRRGDEDRRVVLTRVTEAGLGLLAELDGPVGAKHNEMLNHLGEDKLHQLLALLTDVREHLK